MEAGGIRLRPPSCLESWSASGTNIMTGFNVEACSERSHGDVKIFCELLRSEFGVNAVRLAETQLEAAQGEARVIWQEILKLLHRLDRLE
jgi:hypothetical protein